MIGERMKQPRTAAVPVSVCAVANCRQHRAAENRLRHTVLHENPSFPWADPSLFCINANYIILSGMQIRLDEAMADHLYCSVLYASKSTRMEHLGTARLCAFNFFFNMLLIWDALDLMPHVKVTGLSLHAATLKSACSTHPCLSGLLIHAVTDRELHQTLRRNPPEALFG